MKTKILILSILIISLIFLILNNISAERNEVKSQTDAIEVPDKEFIVGIYDNAWDLFKNYNDSLSLNLWHKYTGPLSGWIYSDIAGYVDTSDKYYNPPSYYEDRVTGQIESNYAGGKRTIMDRPKLAYLSAGQRSDYQAEKINRYENNYWFYSYDTSVIINGVIEDVTDNSPYGSGERVKYCKADTSNPGGNACYILKGLRSNREQAYINDDDYYSDGIYSWYIMPRMRIDSIYASQLINKSKKICDVIIKNWKDSIIKKIEIKVRNFETPNSSYDGKYTENFYFRPFYNEDSSSTIIDSGKLFNPDSYDFSDWSIPCHIDIQVYWYGLCDLWIDRIRVENEPARIFMTKKDSIFQSWLKLEIEFAIENYNSLKPAPNYFFVNEFQFNQLPAIKELNKKILYHSGNKTCVLPSIVYPLLSLHIPDRNNTHLTVSQLKEYLVDSAELNTILVGSYALEGFPEEQAPDRISYMPNTLSNANYNPDIGILAYATGVINYENWLQYHLDTGKGGNKYIHQMKTFDSLIKYPSVNLRRIDYIQTHVWWSPGGWHILKEPSNEEQDLLINLALCYGTKGIWLYPYTSEGEMNSNNWYYRGIMTRGDPGIMKPRTDNVYGQPKYEKLKEINKRLMKWGDYFISFDESNRRTYIYRLENERSICLSETYFSEIKTRRLNPNIICPEYQNPENTYESPDITYLQVGVFNNPDETYNKYFMIVNRRTSPAGIEICDGRRYVIIRFDSVNVFEGFNNWQIKDLYRDSITAVFNKNAIDTINLGIFQPGEGRLYKISPVMIDGGTME